MSARPPATVDIEKKFIAGIPAIFRTAGGNLEVAAFKAVETMRSSSTAILPYFQWKIPGTTATVEVRVPVTYRYHVQVNDKWDIKVADNACIIYAPELRPTLPPAIHTQDLELFTYEGPLAWDGEEQKEKLLKSLTPQLEANAADPRNVRMVRDEARRTVAEFVHTWLLQQGGWGKRKIETIKVIFREEGDVRPESLMPSIVLKE